MIKIQHHRIFSVQSGARLSYLLLHSAVTVLPELEPVDEGGRMWRRKLLQWVCDVLTSLPERCYPILTTDGNFHCGLEKVGAEMQRMAEGDAIGP